MAALWLLALTAPRSTMLIMLSGYKPASPADLRTCQMQGGLLVTAELSSAHFRWAQVWG